MREHYFKSVVMIERLHRLFLEVVKAELSRMNITDITSVQCLILYNIGQEQVTVWELTSRGYYLGSNVSYNLAKMIKRNYLAQEQNPSDRRAIYVRLSEQGFKLYEKLDKLFAMHAQALAHEGIDTGQLEDLLSTFIALEGFWKRFK